VRWLALIKLIWIIVAAKLAAKWIPNVYKWRYILCNYRSNEQIKVKVVRSCH